MNRKKYVDLPTTVALVKLALLTSFAAATNSSSNIISLSIKNGGVALANTTAHLENHKLTQGEISFHVEIITEEGIPILNLELAKISMWNFEQDPKPNKTKAIEESCKIPNVDDSDTSENFTKTKTWDRTANCRKFNEETWAEVTAEIVKTINKYLFILLVFLVFADLVLRCLIQRRGSKESLSL